MEWFYARGGERFGPVDEEELRRLVACGTVRAMDLVWHSGMGDAWVPACKARELEACFSGGGFSAQRAARGNARRSSNAPVTIPDIIQAAREALFRNRMFAATTFFAVVFLCGITRYFRDAVGEAANRNTGSSAWSFVAIAAAVVVWCLSNLLTYGLSVFALRLSRKSSRRDNARFADVFAGFRKMRTVLLMCFLRTLVLVFWSVLPLLFLLLAQLVSPFGGVVDFLLSYKLHFVLLIPAIVAFYSYFMADFVVADNTSISANEALRRSVEMMRGFRWKLFGLHMVFFGPFAVCVAVLAMLILGTGAFDNLVFLLVPLCFAVMWIWPYVTVCAAVLYDEISKREHVRINVREEENNHE